MTVPAIYIQQTSHEGAQSDHLLQVRPSQLQKKGTSLLRDCCFHNVAIDSESLPLFIWTLVATDISANTGWSRVYAWQLGRVISPSRKVFMVLSFVEIWYLLDAAPVSASTGPLWARHQVAASRISHLMQIIYLAANCSHNSIISILKLAWTRLRSTLLWLNCHEEGPSLSPG